ncbi:MAG: hypothetical protein JRJ05_13675 [Deltaproteobacteria bacterium]|nr:hypothetical protein [Deltaproteobacteria bacterium]
MECIVLPARPGAEITSLPPVEIFLGTEPAQYRANRVFAWSIEKVRNPFREVRIHLMSELPGFDRRGWTTGFTNFRFAIPALRGGRGRAIYNDEDQIYLTDPGADRLRTDVFGLVARGIAARMDTRAVAEGVEANGVARRSRSRLECEGRRVRARA